MALFTCIKRHPSQVDRPLTGLFVMDEAQNFAPAQRSTPCKGTTIALAAQARKYGLGMIFATQAPKGIDNKIIGNCTTQFYGKMNAPATIEATRELMASKGGAADDIGRLSAGQFYFSTEGVNKPIKLRTPLLSELPSGQSVERRRSSSQSQARQQELEGPTTAEHMFDDVAQAPSTSSWHADGEPSKLGPRHRPLHYLRLCR
jgi:hypothetical protein